MTGDLATEVQRFNAIGEPLLYRIGLAGLVSRFGADRVQSALVQDSARLGVVSIASAAGWRSRRQQDRKAG
jgi:hypothetical protein